MILKAILNISTDRQKIIRIWNISFSCKTQIWSISNDNKNNKIIFFNWLIPIFYILRYFQKVKQLFIPKILCREQFST